MSDTFPIANPAYNTRISVRPNVNVVTFGDGYEQRLTEGLNQNPLTVNLSFNITQGEADTAIAFLNQRIVNGTSFDYVLPAETNTRKFVCHSYPKSIPYLNRVILNCVFREVFEP